MPACSRWPLLAALGCLACASPKVPAPAPPAGELDPLLERSRAAAREYGAALRAELAAAMEQGGPAGAVEVCASAAPRLAARFGAERGLEVSRVSLRERNPANAARGWTRAVLEDFEARRARGEAPEGLEHHEVAEEGGRRTLRYLRAIPTQSLCLGCHGAELDPEVAARIRRLYPDDRAVGYQVGELRGAFVVVQPL